jgi:hypothetical protein
VLVPREQGRWREEIEWLMMFLQGHGDRINQEQSKQKIVHNRRMAGSKRFSNDRNLSFGKLLI